MTASRLVLSSFTHHWRSHVGAVIAAAVGTAVLTGALLVGDSVRHSLMEMIGQRLGSTQFALVAGDRFFRDDLGARIAARPEFTPYFSSAHAVLLLPGVCIRHESQADEIHAPQVQIIGVGPDFWKLGSGGPVAPLGRGEMVINESLAARLDAAVGDSIVIHINKPGVLPLDAPMGGRKDSYASLRVTVKQIVRDRGLGRFGLSSNQAAPLNAFLSIEDVQAKLEQKGRANMLLIAGADLPEAKQKDAASAADAALQAAWTLDDAQLQIRAVPALHDLELSTARVFLDDRLSDELVKDGAHGILTYFVNWIRNDGNKVETPYSMVCAIGDPFFGENENSNQIVINDWEGGVLNLKEHDKASITIEYWTVGLQRKLERKEATFSLKHVVPMREQCGADQKLMPDFPGIARAETTGDWNAGIPIDRTKIHDIDEEYWKVFRGTPKAFIPIKKGVELWKNRFGTYTALRIPLKGDPETEKAAWEQKLRSKIAPKMLGLGLTPVKFQGIQAAGNGTDFSGLFIGFSFFLIAAALLLMALIFQFGVESRSREIGLLLAVGFTPRRVRMLFWTEGLLLSAIGAGFGVFGAIVYAQTLLNALATRWRDAVGTSALEYYAEPSTLLIGCVSSVAVAAIAIYFAVRKQAALPARELLSSSRGFASPAVAKGGKLWSWIGILSAVSAVGIVIQAVVTGKLSNAELFFSAGSLALIATLALVRRLLLGRWERGRPAPVPTVVQDPLQEGGRGTPAFPASFQGGENNTTLTQLGIRGATRRRGRSLATSALLACGTFLVVAVGANKQDATIDAQSKTAGTGGFALYATSTIPILENLNSLESRHKVLASSYDSLFEGLTIYPFRVRSGDEASCLNLNRAQQPKILGANKEFIERGGFTFAAALNKEWLKKSNPWEMLKEGCKDESVIGAICDDQALTWALGLKLGDTITITDEHGAPRTIKFVATLENSILQGSIIIAEDEFLKLYPSQSGYNVFLIDSAKVADPSPIKKEEPRDEHRESGAKPAISPELALARTLGKMLGDEGFDPVPAAERLAQFNAVENTYLSTFQALGGLGMLLGSAGLGVVVLRNILERRGELAVLRAIGFSQTSIGWLALSEHVWLLLLGLAAGVVSSLVAVVPALQSATQPVPWLTIGVTLGAVIAIGLASALGATWLMLRGPLLAALRSE